ncbi:hypothetical protein SDRG_03091 [Saprolegnia diclina VS20]|uniref:Uncharacterized protein n=1 Tax=Saprolegnia diclina (strain VS20) TaxID=1156394 RepID=T0SA43_SAPDV|nr:hypothetical protein SDRG_03091 [Saprolegnia diclina VS20]EQC39662.1 hypothetical protein SDRG_03091 [Saprolegnia diclina VS20]|eukprot:XP_008606934.1 hypothetical protein SDRG_03091 [Saprolegnia diclina VS20]
MTSGEAEKPPWAPRAYAMMIDADRKVHLHINNKLIELPMSDAVAAAVVAHHGSRSIPATNVRALFVGGIPHVHRLLKDRLVPEGPYTVLLSHVALDAIGSTQSLEPIDAPPCGYFGRLFVCLPSSYEGGAITVASDCMFRVPDSAAGDSTEVQTSPQGLLAVYASTPVTVSPITRGVRVLLVFNLVYKDPVAHSRCGPPTDAEAVTAWIPASAFKFTASFYGRLLTQPSTWLAFEELCATDIRFVTAVAASKKFEISLAYSMSGGDVVYAPWPACTVPNGVVLGASRINISSLRGQFPSACFLRR